MTGSFCTYFDHWYLPRGLALARSLQRHRPGARLWALCLTDLCFEVLRRLAPAGVRPIRLRDLEAADRDLAAVRHDRSLMGYYFTCTPALILHLFQEDRDAGLMTYVDADVFFFADPEPLFLELDGGSVAIVPHRFPPRLRDLERHGIYNVGWVTFRNDERGLACLRSWREQCLLWCHDRVEPGRFAEQKYLDEWPSRFPGVVVLVNPGANLAPWNLDTHRLTVDGTSVRVDGERLIFYHAHGLQLGTGDARGLGLEDYGVALSPVLKAHVYDPYLRALDREQADVDAILDAARHGKASFEPSALAELADFDRALPEREVARLARRQTLERLAECESDRAARLRAFARQAELLAEVEADRAARLESIQRLSEQLAEAAVDRAARLEAMQQLGGRLADADVDRAARLEAMQQLSAQLADADVDRAARLEAMQQLSAQLADAEADRAARLEAIQRLSDRLAEAEADRDTRLEVIRRLAGERDEADARFNQELTHLRALNLEMEQAMRAARAALSSVLSSRSWKATAPLRALGRILQGRRR